MRAKVYGTDDGESPSRIISNLFNEAQFTSGMEEQGNEVQRPRLRRLRAPGH